MTTTVSLTAITGGIGSGKSVVSRMLSAMGHPVYDCDSRAKAIMDTSSEIKSAIASGISESVILPDGAIDRTMLSEIVFADAGALARLNAIVHSAVVADILRWTESLDRPRAWVESAIIYESGIDRIVDSVWRVDAPRRLRLERVMRRSGFTYAQAEARILSQEKSIGKFALHPCVTAVVNDGDTPLLPQIISLLEQ